MSITAKQNLSRATKSKNSSDPSIDSLNIVICPPEFQPLQKEISGNPTNATYVIQRYVAEGLRSRGHNLTFLSPNNLIDIVCTGEIQKPKLALRTWSDSRWFNIISRVAWVAQRKLGVPYLNFFSNFRLLDASLQCFPGHDLVYERNGLYKNGVAMACRRLKLPYILYFEADEILEYDVMGKPLTGVLRWRASEAIRFNLTAADCVICVSKPLKHHLVTNWSVPEKKIVVFPNVSDIHRFRPDPQARAEIRASIRIDNNPLIIFVGNFYEWHDVSTLLEAFSMVLKTNPDARLILVGDGSQRQQMMKRAENLELGQAALFTGLVAHNLVPRFLAAADMAVVPYPTMTQDIWLSPLKLFEYMASGRAIVASAVGQITEVIHDGRNGLLVPPGDSFATAAAILRLIGDPILRSQLGQQAREDAIQKHSWEHYLTRLEQVFLAVIDGHPFHNI